LPDAFTSAKKIRTRDQERHECSMQEVAPILGSLIRRKGDLIQYYADVAPLLLPHIRDRAMVMKRYPHGAAGDFFFMKRAPSPRPDWIRTCRIDHDSGNVIDFPVSTTWRPFSGFVNLGCIDLNQWYATCDDVNRPITSISI